MLDCDECGEVAVWGWNGDHLCRNCIQAAIAKDIGIRAMWANNFGFCHPDDDIDEWVERARTTFKLADIEVLDA